MSSSTSALFSPIRNAGGYDYVPGIYTNEQVEGWKKITDAVHEKGSFIYLQLWALGRTAETAVLAKENNSPYVSASPIPIPGRQDATYSYLVEQLCKHKLACIHIVEAMTPEKNNDFLREIWGKRKGSTYISATGHDRKTAADKKGGLVAFGRMFMSNPDLPFRLLKDIALAEGNQTTWSMRDDLTPVGYSDWPFAPENVQQ
ncbi:FMN-linked oxidoreductase [Rhizopogon vinicolor AM-OR11-026]|uniref:FMN-linked oxidoreductase n=1 Tax=Rhizopogon vinicolor AM-OR11-026 TaxID=1314800 RepID=A0A1B7N391_9AGAM|nr:FMN-linked oxidoreductase [Rhizopogon vinicolor AM-OR11-026]